MPTRIKRTYRLRNKPTTKEYIQGLKAIAPKEKELALLRAQYAAPKRTVTAPELARLADIQGGYPVVNITYGRFGHRLCDHLYIDPDDGSGWERDRWWSIWSVGYSTDAGFLWEMHPEVAEALEQLGWVEQRDRPLPEEVDASLPIFEGAIRHVQVNAYERNTEARRRCISHYGSSCHVCRFDFGKKYGAVCDGYIHVHHLKPLSEIGEQYKVNPIEDLRPVCPNCHAVLHARTPPYSVQEVRDMIRTNGEGESVAEGQ